MTATVTKRFSRSLGLALLASVLLGACAQDPPQRFSCSVPGGGNVEQAFSHARSDLAHPQCQFQFDGYLDRLIAIAADNPGPENRRRFSEFLSWSRDQGILGQNQAETMYQRFFTTEFTVLEDRYNNCSSTCQRREAVMGKLREELQDKDRGLIQVLGDRETYTQADLQYNQLLTLMDATCLACTQAQ